MTGPVEALDAEALAKWLERRSIPSAGTRYFDAAALLRALRATASRAERLEKEVERLREALEPFAKIAPSSLYPADGSEGEEYVVILKDWHSNPLAFTGTDLARARAALASPPGGA